MDIKCERCGCELGPGSGRYIMTVSFTADVDYELPDGDTEKEIRETLDEIEKTPEEDLKNQVQQKSSHYICRTCKEKLAANPLGGTAAQPNTIQ